jgi:TPP-dependent pyruvate/acetoin dehydrogenase alpha subunit
VVAAVFGDGAVDEGVFYESLNFAALKRLPVLFLCENNAYAIHTHQRLRQHVPDACARAAALGLEAERVLDGDVFEIARQARAAAEALRAGSGPRFLECLTYRWKEHVGPGEDWQLGYREPAEAEPWMRDDAVPRAAALLPAEVAARIRVEVEAEIADAFAFAEASPFPGPEELHRDVFRGAR